MIILAAATCVATSCAAPASKPKPADEQAIRAEVADWLQSFWAVWSDGGAGFDRGMAMFEDHPDFTLASDAGIWRSVAAVDAAFRPFFETIDHQTVEITETAISVLSRDVVCVTQGFRYTPLNKDGTSVGPAAGAGTLVLVRTDTGWKARMYHQSEPNTPSVGTN